MSLHLFPPASNKNLETAGIKRTRGRSELGDDVLARQVAADNLTVMRIRPFRRRAPSGAGIFARTHLSDGALNPWMLWRPINAWAMILSSCRIIFSTGSIDPSPTRASCAPTVSPP
jgi:hypothetical protein